VNTMALSKPMRSAIQAAARADNAASRLAPKKTAPIVAWPGRYPEVEGAIRNLSEQAHEYIRYFDTRSESSKKWVREDQSYKRIFPNPNYYEEAEKSERWVRVVQRRLGNMVVALNGLFAAVRQKLRPTYRLREGRPSIHDLMGVTNQLVPVVWYPKEPLI